jgi:drug/metabolite transporter (DMT)-like permease
MTARQDGLLHNFVLLAIAQADRSTDRLIHRLADQLPRRRTLAGNPMSEPSPEAAAAPARSRLAAAALALGAIALWTTLAALAVSLKAVPPFLLVGAPLLLSGLISLPTWRSWRVPIGTFATGVYGLFGFHCFLFAALQNAPPVEANLINYLWPLLIVLLAPLFMPSERLTVRHALAALLGFSGAALVITGGHWTLSAQYWRGYLLALGAALVWSTYSLLTKRLRPFPTAAVGGFCLMSGALALVCHALWEPRYAPTGAEWLRIALLALGPLGLAYFLWDAALKRADARAIGALAFLTPLGSTLVLIVSGLGQANWTVAAAAILIVAGAALGAASARD